MRLLARRGLLHPFIGPKPDCGISERVTRWVIGDWMCREQQGYWQFVPGQRHAKSFLFKPSDKRTVEFLKHNRSQA
jgi:hypothetical protein